MTTRRKNGEGSWGTKKIKGVEYKYFRKTYNDTDKYFYGKTDKEIKAKVKIFEDGLSFVVPKDIDKQYFGDYILNWLKVVKQPSVKRRTYDGYEDIINVQIINHKGYDISSKQIGNINNEMFQLYYNDLANKYSRGTIRKNYVIIKQCLDYAKTKKHIPENYLDMVTIPSEDLVKVKKKEIKFLTESDMDKLYEETKRINIEGFNFGGKIGQPVYGNNAYAIVLIMYTGLRIGELISLKWQDIELDKKFMYVKSSVSSIKNRDKKSETDSKYIKAETSVKTKAGVRSIPLSDRAIEMINILSNNNPNHKETDNIFLNKNGNIVNRANVTRTLHAMLIRANCDVKKCGLHSLRHSFGSYLILHKIDVKVVSQLLGHKDVLVTYNIYVHLIEQQKIEAVNIFDVIKNEDIKVEDK
jgi:integrase